MSTPTVFANSSGDDFPPLVNQLAILDILFPGFSTVSAGLSKYLQIDISFYLPFIVICGIVIYASNYVSGHLWSSLQHYLMSTADIRIDDEMYNYVMGWVTLQKFSQANLTLYSYFGTIVASEGLLDKIDALEAKKKASAQKAAKTRAKNKKAKEEAAARALAVVIKRQFCWPICW
ncbi:hypothetical protein VE03_10371 [Pseudogymnoascus sp. 23342-1-I1]|nr:hypothetical protein VE03_10371 [Pseudogymnoascus sp. 23342-1-I1]